MLNEEFNDIFAGRTHKEISKLDSSFSSVPLDDLSRQLLLLRLEVIGIAFQLNVPDDLSPDQSECTMRYFESIDASIWDDMDPYNVAVAKSVTGGFDGANEVIGRLERSATAWRPYLWPIKVTMIIGIFLMLLQSISELIKDIAKIKGEQL